MLGSVLAVAASAPAAPDTCQRGIATAAGKFVKAKSKALQRCEDRKVAGSLAASTSCPSDPATAGAIQRASGKLGSAIGRACGGADHTCGNADDEPLGAIGWGGVPACPNFEHGSCTNAVSSCNGIAVCLGCVDEAAIDQAMTLYYGALANAQFGSGSAVNRCQRTIGKETTKFLQAKAKALGKCWSARIRGRHANDCPSPGDGKASVAIQRAEQKKVSAICRACGGPDQACGGADDLTPAAIGFASSCPDVTVPGGAACGGPIADLQDVVTCVDCVTEFKVDCMDRLTVPEFATYPSECNPTTTTTTATTVTTSSTSSTTTTTSTTTTIPATCGNGVVDPGEDCDPSSPSGALICPPGESCTAACTCQGATTTTTTSTTTTTQPVASFLEFTTGAAGGVCGNTYSDTSGTTVIKNLTCGGLDIGGGNSTVPEGQIPNGSTSRFTASCTGSTCTLGPTSAPGATFDCTDTGCRFGPPLPIPNGTLSTCVANTFSAPASGSVDLSTGDSSMAVALSSNVVVTGNNAQPCPICRSGSTSGPACAGTPAVPCSGVCEGSPNQGSACVSTNSQGLSRDCPQPGSNAAGNRCYKGTNNNGACVTNTQCPGGVCAVFVGAIPVNLAPLTTGTASLADPAGNFCPGQKTAGCFTNPNSGSCRLIREQGAPSGSLLPLGTPKPATLASVFCIPASGNTLIDGAAALPGPGATSLPGTVVAVP